MDTAMFLLGLAADIGARFGVAIAAMGIAVEWLRPDHYYTPPFRIFCAVCQGLGTLIAVVLAARSRRRTSNSQK
jgi:hypothetical protein